MSEVVLVHGAFHELWGPMRLGFRWAPPLLDGLWAAGVDISDVTLERVREELTVAFWGDIFRLAPDPARRDAAEAIDVAQLAESLRSDGPGAIDALAKELAGRTQQRSVELLGRYFTEPEVKEHVHRRVDHVLGPDTKVVIAHSMGTVISYQVLCARPDLRVEHFVTLGSPLGTPGLVLEQLDPTPVDGRGVWPSCVKDWTNVAAENDLATLAAPRLAEVFGERVTDEFVFNGRHPHDIEPYLTAAETGLAVAAGLGLHRVR
jgi:pimeloyl-ACP methyl ester carboxylesterase